MRRTEEADGPPPPTIPTRSFLRLLMVISRSEASRCREPSDSRGTARTTVRPARA